MSLEDQATTFNDSLTWSQLQSAPLQYLLAPVIDDSEVDLVVHKANGGESVATTIEKYILETQMISQSLHFLAGEPRNGPRDSEGT